MKTTLSFLLIVFAIAASANTKQQDSVYTKHLLLKLKKESPSAGSKIFSHLLINGKHHSVPVHSEDYSWNQEMNGWEHVSSTTYSYDSYGRLTDELVSEPGTDRYISRITNAYDLYGNNTVTEEFEYNSEINQWFPVSGEMEDYTISIDGQINGVIQKAIENGVWVNKSRVEYILDQYNIPTQLLNYQWDGYNWVLYSRMGLLTWADWPHRELDAYTLQYMQENNWINAERYSTQYAGNSHVATTVIWDNGQWLNSKRESYSKNEIQEEIILEEWSGQGWEKTEKYQGTFDPSGNPTGMEYSSWQNNSWETEMALFFDLTINESDDVTEMIIRYWDPSLNSPENLSKYVYSDFIRYTTGVPEITNLHNVKVFPNPVSTILTIEIEENNLTGYRVNLINVNGETVLSRMYSEPVISVNAEKFTPGIYFLNIKSDEGQVFNSKILKK